MKHLLQISLVVCILASLSSFAESSKTEYNPSNTAIVFDIDGVILKRTIPIPGLIWRHKYEIFKAFFDTALLKEVTTLFRMTAPVGVYISLFERKRPGLVTFARELATTRVPKMRTVCVIDKLLGLGYKLHIGTNETENEFALHKARFPVFSRFTTYTFADYSTFPNVTQKPMHSYFEHMKEHIFLTNKKIEHLIFIDDRTDNVQAARETGYIGIDFSTPENLETAFIEMGIMQKQTCFSIPEPLPEV